MQHSDVARSYGGSTGWIGCMLVQALQQRGIAVVAATGNNAARNHARPIAHPNSAAAAARMEKREAVEAELDRVQPTHVINAAGVTGRPNVSCSCAASRRGIV